MLHPRPTMRVPAWTLGLFVADVALVIAPVVDFVLGSPSGAVRTALHLDLETSLPAWYSSMQWLCASFLFALPPVHLWRLRPPGWWTLSGLALLCLAFSIDEILGVHEWLGGQTDRLLPGDTRDDTLFHRTGIWPLVIGIPVVMVIGSFVFFLRRVFGTAEVTAYRRLILGLVLMFTGALLVELLKNFTTGRPHLDGLAMLQLATEELLEMVGVTFIVWAASDFARFHGFALRTPVAASAHDQQA